MKVIGICAVASLATMMTLGVVSAAEVSAGTGGNVGAAVGNATGSGDANAAGSANAGAAVNAQGADGKAKVQGSGDAGASAKTDSAQSSASAMGKSSLGVDISGAGDTPAQHLAFFNKLSPDDQKKLRDQCHDMPANTQSPDGMFCSSLWK